MKGKNPWHSPVAIVITAVAVTVVVALVTVAVLQNRPLPQKYKVGWPVAGEAPSLRACCVAFCCVASVRQCVEHWVGAEGRFPCCSDGYQGCFPFSTSAEHLAGGKHP